MKEWGRGERGEDTDIKWQKGENHTMHGLSIVSTRFGWMTMVFPLAGAGQGKERMKA